jgi:hypothetical protein
MDLRSAFDSFSEFVVDLFKFVPLVWCKLSGKADDLAPCVSVLARKDSRSSPPPHQSAEGEKQAYGEHEGIASSAQHPGAVIVGSG